MVTKKSSLICVDENFFDIELNPFPNLSYSIDSPPPKQNKEFEFQKEKKTTTFSSDELFNKGKPIPSCLQMPHQKLLHNGISVRSLSSLEDRSFSTTPPLSYIQQMPTTFLWNPTKSLVQYHHEAAAKGKQQSVVSFFSHAAAAQRKSVVTGQLLQSRSSSTTKAAVDGQLLHAAAAERRSFCRQQLLHATASRDSTLATRQQLRDNTETSRGMETTQLLHVQQLRDATASEQRRLGQLQLQQRRRAAASTATSWVTEGGSFQREWDSK
ncbi:hypothetical protein SESBI_32970 [Sesbania bispinosa]|nr:hypothetical protein SESBI_32970 [Sesbania bispinosa]